MRLLGDLLPFSVNGRSGMEFLDRLLTCRDCGGEFIFTAGEQVFFFDKQFQNDPKRCKRCKFNRTSIGLKAAGAGPAAGFSRTETRADCAKCGLETTVPFKPTQGRPVLCRQCFQSTLAPTTGALVTAAATAEMIAGMGAEHFEEPISEEVSL
jgi:CxxC-x17-CxxC domain-containing protein